MRTRYLIGLFVILLLHPLPSHARWEGARDNKSSTQLAAMTNQQLFDEAFDVCVRRALLESLPTDSGAQQSLTDCNDYFTTLSPYVRERNGGKTPAWMGALETSHTTKECQAAFRTFVSKAEKPASASPAETPTHAPVEPAVAAGATEIPRAHRVPPLKPTPAQPRSHWSEQLPPWIAPH